MNTRSMKAHTSFLLSSFRILIIIIFELPTTTKKNKQTKSCFPCAAQYAQTQERELHVRREEVLVFTNNNRPWGMSFWSFKELSNSLLSPKTVGVWPFFLPKEERLDTTPPPFLSAVWDYMHCSKRAINTRIIGFCEPTLQQCVDDLVLYTKASSMGGCDGDALAEVLRRRRGDVDVDSLPWQPRSAYKEWLSAQGRLGENK